VKAVAATQFPPRDDIPLVIRVRFRDGDPDALAEVYDRYSRAVWSVAVRVTRTDQLAQDAVQETFIRAWRAASSYDPARPLGPWLLSIARFTALDIVRHEQRPTRGGHETEQDAVIESPGMDEAWLAWTVQEALRSLAEHEREIVRLSFFEDLTHVQIAERLDLPVGTVKSRSHRAHRRLAEVLSHLREGSGELDGSEPVPVSANHSRGGSRTPDLESARERREG
jgi:RNA polymerase sigma-70 factor (ECF subfamily)